MRMKLYLTMCVPFLLLRVVLYRPLDLLAVKGAFIMPVMLLDDKSVFNRAPTIFVSVSTCTPPLAIS